MLKKKKKNLGMNTEVSAEASLVPGPLSCWLICKASGSGTNQVWSAGWVYRYAPRSTISAISFWLNKIIFVERNR